MTSLVKHICVYCKTVQYIPTRLRKLVQRMYCYVCKKEIDNADTIQDNHGQ